MFIARSATTELPLPALLALATAAFTDVMTDLLPAGLLPQMSASLHVPEARIGLLVTAFAVTSALAAIPVTAALRSLPRRGVLIAVLTGFGLFDAVTAVSSSYPLTFAARLLAGVMGGTLWSMLAGYAARMVPAGRRGRAIAIVLAGITLALSAGLPAGTALAARLGWRPVFALLATLALIAAAWIRWKAPGFPGERAGQRPPLGVAVRRVAVRPGLPAVLAVTLLLLTGHQELYTYLAPFAARSGPGHTGLVLLVFGLATIPGLAVTGLLADRHLRSVLIAALTLVVAALLALGLTGRDLGPMLALAALWGAAFGGVPALLQTALIGASGPGYADLATSLQTTVYNIGIAAGSLVGGLVLQNAGAPALPWAASVLIAGALAIVCSRRVGLRHGSPELTGSG